jgi:hypothetical protein
VVWGGLQIWQGFPPYPQAMLSVPDMHWLPWQQPPQDPGAQVLGV